MPNPYHERFKVAHLHIRFYDIVSATNCFADDNLIKRGSIANVYKGKLLHSKEWIDVVIRRFHLLSKIREFEFLREIATLCRLNHRNTLPIVGFCNENGEMMMVFKFENNGSLDKYLGDPSLTWSQRLKICLGVASALRYIHNDVERHLVKGFHHDIKSTKILLDKDWEAKLFCFGFHIGYDVVFHSTSSYADPTAERDWGFSHMSDVYSFGVILFEVLCDRKALIGDKSLVPMATRLYEEGKLDDIINPGLRKQMHPQSVSIFTQIAFDCVKKRTRMDLIVERLQEALDLLSKHERLEKDFAYLKIPLSDIMLATENFATKYCIRSHREGMVYKAELDHFDIGSLLTIKGNELPKMCCTVTIKRNISRNYGQVAERFIKEIEMLTACKDPNIESLLGFSWEESEMILVYESAFNGSLSDYLGSTSSERTNLTWEQRIQICLDIARGLEYFQTYMEPGEPISITPQGIHSGNVMLGEKWNAKIANIMFFSYDDSENANNTKQGLGYFYSYIPNILHQEKTNDQRVYGPAKMFGNYIIDSQSSTMKKYIYSFGVVLFEILCGRLAYDSIYIDENDKGLAPIARRHFKERTLKKIIDPKIMEEAREYSYITKIGPDQRSLDTFGRIAYQCLSEIETERPTVEVVFKSLKNALCFEVENLEHLKIRLSDIVAATNNFTENKIGQGGFGAVYRAELDVTDRRNSSAIEMTNEDELPKKCTVAIKRNLRKQDDTGFRAELEIINRCEHPNIISLLGFCVEDSEKILVFEHASNGSLDDYLKNGEMSKLRWAQRLKICLGIAYGLSYLHTTEGDKECIIHCDIKSGNILLDENLKVKIADFGLSMIHPMNDPKLTIYKNRVGTPMYWDPEFAKQRRLKVESDIYSFGVVLFEILTGKLAYDPIYNRKNEKGIAPVARWYFNNERLKEMVDTEIMDEAHELSSTLRIGPNQDSLNAFLEVAYPCLAKAQDNRPTMEDVINGLKRALDLQENRKDTLEISLKDIRFNGVNFSDTKCVIKGGLQMLYNAEVQYDNGYKSVIVKRLSKSGLEHGIWREFEIPFKLSHENVIGLVGYCKKMNEKFIVYENASNRSLDRYLNDASFAWTKRLSICIGIAEGLNFLHGGDVGQEVVIHRDIKSYNILLTGDWKAKICGFEFSLISPINQEKDDVVGSPGYCDPSYWETHFLTKESDIYSLGVILFEILWGRLACPEDFRSSSEFLDYSVRRQYELIQRDEIVFKGIKRQIVPKSLATFRSIAFKCLNEERKERPTAGAVLVQLQKALEFQEAGTWEAKLPTNYQQILEYSESPGIYSTMEKKDIYSKLFNGILLQEGKLWFSIGCNGERNEMFSARIFSYKNHRSRRWQTIQESRFKKVAEMLDVSNLNIQIKRRPQLLLPSVNYSVHLVFKFCCPRKSHAKRMYVNLKYKMGNENLSAYFATWREDGWMMIELYRSSSHKKESNIEVLLKSFSRCYCDSRGIYIEGIEFRAINDASLKVKQEKIEKLDQIQQPILKSNSCMDIVKFNWFAEKFGERLMASMITEVDAKWVLYSYSDKKLVQIEGSSHSRFEGIELLRQSAFHIKWKISSQMLSPNTEHACYLVFKLSEKCSGLHCPVIVRDQYRWKSKESLYFRYPSPWNVQETDQVPKKRRDGWMEVIVWIYNLSSELRNESLYVNLKLTSYEGNMSGLIIRGLEFRPMEK